MLIKLLVEDDVGQRKIYELDNAEVNIGRLPQNNIVLDARNVSRYHAKLVVQGTSLLIHDLNSDNGVWKNGSRISGWSNVEIGDSLRIGDFNLRLYHEEPKRFKTTQPIVNLPASDDTESAVGEPSPPRQTAPLLETREAKHYPRLIGISHHFFRQVFAMTQKVTILGRSAECDIYLDHRSVSRQHAKITQTDGRVQIEDLESSNGLLINFEPYHEVDLYHGDLVELGHLKFRFASAGKPYLLSRYDKKLGRGPWWQRQSIWALLLLAAAFALVMLDPTLRMQLATVCQQTTSTLLASWNKTLHPSNSELERLLREYALAQRDKQYEKALVLLDAALVLNPMEKSELQTARQELARQVQGSRNLALASSMASKNMWSDAWNTLQDVPKQTDAFTPAQLLANQVKTRLIDERLAECRKAIDHADWEMAQVQLEEIEGLDPLRPDVLQLHQLIKTAQAQATAKTATRPALHTTSLTNKDTKPHSKSVAKKAESTAASRTNGASQLYREAVLALQQNRLLYAIERAKACVLADSRNALCFRTLGIAFARNGNAQQAIEAYRRYIQLDPHGPEAAKVRQLIKDFNRKANNAAP